MSTRPDLPSYRTLLTEVDRGVATITLNRPGQRNAVGDGMREELADAYRFCDRDHGIHLAVMRHDDARDGQERQRIRPATT